MAGYDAGKKEIINHSRLFLGSRNLSPEIVNAWSETSLPTLLSNYDLEDIYNADEFRLFCQCLPNKIYQLKSDKWYEGKLSKIRIVKIACQQQMLWAISYPCLSLARRRIHASKISGFYLVTTEINKKLDGWEIEEWLRELDRKFASEG